MSKPIDDVTTLLAQLTAPGSFATRRTAARSDLRLEVKGVGRIGFPVTKATAAKLCAAGLLARHGYKTETRLDRRVRDTWEVPAGRIAIDKRRWDRTLLPQLEVIRHDLGLPEDSRLKVSLHNLLIYEPGQFFVPHQDSEKSDDMIATLIVLLPSDFSGGEMVIRHHDRTVTFRGSRQDLAFIAFYADCQHEIRPVTRGYRVALTYTVSLTGAARSAAAAPVRHVTALADGVERFFRTKAAPRWAHDVEREPPDRLVYLLDHEYTPRGLGWNRLKGADRARAASLRDVAQRLDCEVFLALADVHETWSCEDEDFGYGGYGYRRRLRRRDLADDDLAEQERTAARRLIELLDSAIELRHWVGSGERPEAISASVDDQELCYTKPSRDMRPFRSEHEGYMGNWGNTVDRWYHRAAVVLWPRERTFVIRARASADWAIREVARAIDDGRLDEARQMTERLVPFWEGTARLATQRGFAERTLAVAGRLDHTDLAAALLEPFTLSHLRSTRAAGDVATLLERYGLDWCQIRFRRWAHDTGSQTRDERVAWIGSSLPVVCRVLAKTAAPAGVALARWLVNEQWTYVETQVREASEHVNPADAERAARALSRPLLSVINNSLIASDSELHQNVIAFLSSPASEHPIPAIVHLLRAAHDREHEEALPGLGLQPVHAYCARSLRDAARGPARAPDDWSIAVELRCSCPLCGNLSRFLRAAGERTLEWPLAKERRAHVHAQIDRHGLPVSHVTRRTGSPHRLVLTKTDALFERDAAARDAALTDLAWLTTTADAFAAAVGV
ncbi:MAG: 2OG-Fe(II) oxygenase [Acidobacteriota bacterium]